MEPIKIELPPGLLRNSTGYSQMGRWNDGNLIRFFDKTIRPIGGWDVAFDGTALLTGNARCLFTWKDNDQAPFMLILTHSNAYVHDGTTLDEVTPSGFVAGHAHTSAWTADNFGEIGIACNDSTETIYELTPGGGLDLTAVTNAPDALAVFCTEERFVVALGADGNPRRVAWCDQESRTVWTPTAINQAGDLDLQTAGVVQCGAKVRGGALIWTDVDLHFMRYIGMPNVYGIERVADKCGIVGRHAFQVVDTSAYWMGQNAFYHYQGYVEPMKCDVADDVFSNINPTYRHKVWCLHIAEFAEIWWFYPRGSETECSNYVVLNYREGHWNHGTLPRLAGAPQGAFDYPAMITEEGRIMFHEHGWDTDESVFFLDDDGVTRLTDDDGTYLTDDPGDVVPEANRYLISGPIELGNGARRLMIDEFIPDETTQGDCDVYFYTREYPNATETTLGPYTASDRVGVLTTARQVRIELRADNDVEDFRVGTYRAFVKARGRY